MNKFRLTVKLMAIAIFMFAFASMAQAQATRTWVSGVGDDANPCSRTAPCKTFAGAISKTAICGEIDALDPGGFGAVTITKPITIDGTAAGIAGVLVSGTNGIIIAANAATDVVTLRALDINGICSGLNGIQVNSAKEVNVEDCVIYKFTQNGINFAVGAASMLNVRNTVIRDNTGDGVGVSTSTGQVKGSFIHCSFTGNGNGLHAKINSRLVASDCNFSGNSNNGVLADGGTGVIRISESQISNNAANGVNGGSGGVVSINSCDVHNNGGSGALVSGGGEVDTYGNNRIFANGTDGCVSCTAKTPA